MRPPKLSDECYTPAQFIRLVRDVLGGIDCDPASSDTAQAVVRARRFYTLERSGLRPRVRWRGRVWLNCPYSDPSTWIDRLLAEYDAGHATEAICLVNSWTGAPWFQRLAARAWRCEKRKRIMFYGPGTRPDVGTGFKDNVFFYLGAHPARFAAAFREIGTISGPALPQSVTESVTTERACAACGRSLAGRRSHSRACSPRCRKRLERRAG